MRFTDAQKLLIILALRPEWRKLRVTADCIQYHQYPEAYDVSAGWRACTWEWAYGRSGMTFSPAPRIVRKSAIRQGPSGIRRVS